MLEQNSTNDFAKRVYDNYTYFQSETSDWRTDRADMEQRYFGNSYKPEDIDKGEADAPPIQVEDNRIRPAIKRRIVRLSGRPRGVVYGLSAQEDEMDIKLQRFLDYIADLSKASQQMFRLAYGQQAIGVGYMYLYDDPLSDYGFGDLKFRYLHYTRVFYDPEYESLQEAPTVIIRTLYTKQKFMQLFPGVSEDRVDELITNDVLDSSLNENSQRETTTLDNIEDGADRQFILVLDQFQKKREKRIVVRSVFGDMLEIRALTAQMKKKKEADITEEDLYSVLSPEAIEAIQTGNAIITLSFVPVVYHSLVASDKEVLEPEEEFPISQYPIFEAKGEETRNGFSVGEIDFSKSQQDIINAALNVVLANAGAASIPNWIGDLQKLMNCQTETDFKEKMSQFGGLVNAQRDPITGDWPIQRLDVGQIDPTFERVLAYAINSLQQATDSPDQDPKAAKQYMVQVKQDQDIDRQLLVARTNLEQCLSDMYTAILEWAPKYYTLPKQIIIFNEDNDSEEVATINTPKLGGEGFISDMTKVRAKYRVRPGSTVPVVSVEMAETLMRLYEITQNPIFVAEMLKYMPVANRKKLLEELDLVPQMQQQIQQLQQQNQQVSAELTRQTQQNIEMQKALDVQRTGGKMDAAYTRFVADLKIMLNKMQSDIDTLKKKSSDSSK